MKRILILMAMAIFLAATVGIVAQRTGGRAAPAAIAQATFEYAAKFVCGEFDKLSNPVNPAVPEGPVKPGNYQTAINVHNPNSTAVPLRKKAVLLFSGDAPIEQTEFEVPKPPGTQIFPAELPPDWGLEIDCQDIRKQLLGPLAPPAPTFIKGWVVIASSAALDIEVVFTGHGYKPDPAGIVTREGFSLYVERVLPTQGVR
jgi:hypothetical protein